MYYKFISAGVPVPWAYCITPLGRTWKPEGAYFSLKLLIINSELCDYVDEGYCLDAKTER